MAAARSVLLVLRWIDRDPCVLDVPVLRIDVGDTDDEQRPAGTGVGGVAVGVTQVGSDAGRE
ncbi:MAG TPA: hypothetical protein VIM10_02495 [Actinopolymorphaceae bacterium]